MASIEELDLATGYGASADQRGVLSRASAVAQEAVDVNNNLRQRQADADQAAKQRVQLRHPHRCRDAFSRNIAEHKEELPPVWVQIAIVAADGPDRRVMIARFPTVDFQVSG